MALVGATLRNPDGTLKTKEQLEAEGTATTGGGYNPLTQLASSAGRVSKGDVTALADPFNVAEPIKDAVGDVVDSVSVDTTPSQVQTDRTTALADTLSKERLGYQTRTAPVTDATQDTQTRDQQEKAIADLAAAAAGKVPSAAELQLQRQSSIDAARQFGLASALGGHSAGGALRRASEGAADIAGTTNQQQGILRAQEQAQARTSLADLLTKTRTQDQASALANLEAKLKTMGLDDAQIRAILDAQIAASGQAVTSAGQVTAGNAAAAAARAQMIGAAASGAGGILSSLTRLSDKRAKKDVKETSLADALGRDVHGVSYTYKPGMEDGKEHFGVLAQELEKVIPTVVKKDANGMRSVDIGHVSLANTAIAAELARRVGALEGKNA